MRITLALVAGLAGPALLAPAAAKAEEMRYNYIENRWEPASAAQRRMSSAMMRKPAKEFMRKEVRIGTNEAPGTIIIDSERHFLYFVEGNGRATRYGVGVGREGFGWSGTAKVGRKAEWPDWYPPKEMIVRERVQNKREIPAYMPGGPDNPLGAAALYLYQNGRDTMFRIHGTNQPWTIGQSMSSGCIRMMNQDVQDLYTRAGPGTKVVVIDANGAGRNAVYAEAGPRGILDAIFGG
ncbi:L,D-transpeptidase [Aureimonas endophytica]|uniref:L,D-transpeptidase n=1 Tax=Aureimonas endophytica TaxID=2027858 RepID=A0A917E3I7_9HYPH|nr:L,D-transpeptidase [Aureimonas endophytica]